jgi:hypothetical protein
MDRTHSAGAMKFIPVLFLKTVREINGSSNSCHTIRQVLLTSEC